MKKTYQCKNCGTIYTSNLGVCPQCSAPYRKCNGKTVLGFIFIFLAVTLFVAGVVSVISLDSSETPDNNSPTDSSEVSRDLTLGSTLHANGLNITLKNVEDWNSDNMFIQPKDGNKFIRAYFILENTNSSSRFLGSFDFSCYADNAKVDDKTIYGEDILGLGTEISAGRVLQGYVYYEVPVNAESIEIEYSSSWWGKNAIFIVK